jgi:hypothetical protein
VRLPARYSCQTRAVHSGIAWGIIRLFFGCAGRRTRGRQGAFFPSQDGACLFRQWSDNLGFSHRPVARLLPASRGPRSGPFGIYVAGLATLLRTARLGIEARGPQNLTRDRALREDSVLVRARVNSTGWIADQDSTNFQEGRYAPGSRGGEENQRPRSGPWGPQPGASGDRSAIIQAPGAALQPPGRTRRQRLPTGDDARALSCLHVVRDAGEQPAQLDCGRQLPLLLECSADRGGFGFGDDEHPCSMVMGAVTGKPCVRGQRIRRIIPIAVGDRWPHAGSST